MQENTEHEVKGWAVFLINGSALPLLDSDGQWRIFRSERWAEAWASVHVRGQYAVYPIIEGGDDDVCSDEIQ